MNTLTARDRIALARARRQSESEAINARLAAAESERRTERALRAAERAASHDPDAITVVVVFADGRIERSLEWCTDRAQHLAPGANVAVCTAGVNGWGHARQAAYLRTADGRVGRGNGRAFGFSGG